MWHVRSRIADGLAVALLAAAIAGCDSTAPTPSPAPVLGIDWGRVASVERPANYEETVSPSYVGKHPILRIQGQATIADVIALPRGGVRRGRIRAAGLGAVRRDIVGRQSPGRSTRWAVRSSPSPSRWRSARMAQWWPSGDPAVSRSRGRPARGDRGPPRGPVLPEDDDPERMTTVIAGPNGFALVASVGPELSDRDARFWCPRTE